MAATASALMIGVALVAVVATLVASAKTTITDTVREEVLGEYQVQVQGFTGDPSSGISPELARELRALPEVAVAATWRIGDWYEPGSGGDDSTSFGPGFDTRYLIGVDPDMDRVVDLGILAGSFADLTGDAVMIYEDFADDRGLTVGDTVEIEYPDFTPAALEVVAVFDGQLFGTELIIPMATYKEHYTYGLDQMAIIGLAEGIDVEEARPALEAVTDKYPNADLNNAEEYLDQISSQLDLITNMLYGLLGMAIIIALLGIANTLALSIMERKREIGLLRAVGMSRRQVRRMVRWEAVLIAVFGAVIGVVVGVLLGVAVVMAIGQGLAITIPWSNLVVYVIAGMIGGVIASIWPAWRGSRTDLLEAIHYE
jgi:putative ABC transport system permease protein